MDVQDINEISKLLVALPGDTQVKLGPNGYGVAYAAGNPDRGNERTEWLSNGYNEPLAAVQAAHKAWYTQAGNRTQQLDAVRSCFEDAWGDLYVDEEHIAPMWDSAWPSVDNQYAGEATTEAQVLECARRVAAAIAILAYGTDVYTQRSGMLPDSPVGA